MKTREKFAQRFGEEQAEKIEVAAKSHDNIAHNNKGSDPFKWAIAICIRYQCVENEDFKKFHGITISLSDFENWVTTEADLPWIFLVH